MKLTTLLFSIISSLLALSSILIFPQDRTQQPSSVKNWQKHTVIHSSNMILSTAAGDFNNNGKIDIIAAYGGKIYIHHAPEWKPSVIGLLDSEKARGIATVSIDIDSDGDLDIITADANSSPIWLENPHPLINKRWSKRTIDNKLRGIHDIILADVNNNGKTNIIINSFRPEGELANSAMWYQIPEDPHNNTLWKRNIFANGSAQGGSHYFDFGDINGDGWGEIALAAKGEPFPNGNWFAYWKNPTKENIHNPWEKTIVRENEKGATNIKIAHINNDNLPDFVITNGHGKGIFWLKAPNWEKYTIDSKIECPHSLTSADFNEDGSIDIASCGFKSKRLSLYINEGTGKFKTLNLDLNQSSYDLKAIDIDQDGDLDILNAGREMKTITWYENPLK